MIVGLVSSFREGRLVAGAIESLRPACDVVLVLEGPAPAEREPSGPESELRRFDRAQDVIVRRGAWQSDAAKRSELADWARVRWARARASRGPLWLLVLDADELLLWGEYLPDYLAWLDGEPDAIRNATGGFPLRHVEPDGSVHLSYGRVLNGLQVRRYLVSGYQLELASGLVVALPLLPLCSAGGIPLAPAEGPPRDEHERDLWLAQHRPPLAGEPHVLHRHPLRQRGRAEQRMHDDEAAWFSETVRDLSA